MITVISGTNRPDSRASAFALYAYEQFRTKGADVRLLSLTELPADFVHASMYEASGQSPALAALQNEFVIPAQKFYFVIPEYNGGYPGILKLFLDACSIRAYKESFHGGKKAALLGVAAGRAGNLRGIEHFAGVLNYLQIAVMPPLQPIGSIEPLVRDGRLVDEAVQKVVSNQIDKFLQF